MIFHAGDRVKVKSLNTTGIVIESNDKTSTVAISDPKVIEIARPKEKIKVTGNLSPVDVSKREVMTYWTFTADLEHLSSSVPEPDWKSIWDRQ